MSELVHQQGPMSLPISLYKKIQAVSNEIKNLEKDMVVGTGAYAYKAVSDQQVVLAVKDAETKHKIITIPVNVELISSEVLRTVKKNGDEGITYVENIRMTVRIVDLETGDYIEITSLGKGIDSGDKGFGKASTYARKYAILNAYKIATGEDPDANKSEEQTGQKTVSDKRKAVTNYLNNHNEVRLQLLQYFSVQEMDDLNEKQIDTVYSTYKQKGLI